MNDFVINIDKGVKVPPRSPAAGFGNTRGSAAAKYDTALKSLDVGDSFFLEGETIKTTNLLFNHAKAIGVPLKRAYVESDSVYVGKSGVRLERISAEEAAERKRKPKAEAADAGTQSPTPAAAPVETAPAAAPVDDDDDL